MELLDELTRMECPQTSGVDAPVSLHRWPSPAKKSQEAYGRVTSPAAVWELMLTHEKPMQIGVG